MRYAETGIDLEIDLSRGSIEKKATDHRSTELHLGGYGINAKILWDRCPPEVGPFSPDNLLIMGTGLLVGTMVPAANRTCVSTVGPLTGLHLHSMAGGFWGPELKHAGYDKIILRGKSPEWVYLWIKDNKVEIRDASHLVGKGTMEATRLIQQELKDDKVQVAAIGLAGENRVYFASIELGKSSCSRGGMGAVMGDKKLKAVVVRGTKDIYVARPSEIFEFCSDITRKLRADIDAKTPPEERGFIDYSSWDLPESKLDDESFHTDNFAWGNVRERRRGFWNEEVEKKWHSQTAAVQERLISCYNCPSRCTTVVKAPELPAGRYLLKCSKYTYPIAAYQDMDFGYRIFGVGEEYGMDNFTTPQILAFAVELYDNGILTDKAMPGFPSDAEGRFFYLIHKIARREGIGNILADGTYRAARQIGKGAELYEHNTMKKMENLPLKLGMLNYHYYLMYCTDDKNTIVQIRGCYPQLMTPTGPPDKAQREEYVKDWVQAPSETVKQTYVNDEPRSTPTFEATCEITNWTEAMHRIDDCTGICSMLSAGTPKGLYHIHNYPQLISLAAGIDLDEAGLWKIHKRNFTLVRSFNVRRGINRKDDRVPADHWKHRFPEIEAKLLDEYYKNWKGWDSDGIPTKETLHELDLDYVSEDLEKRGILKNENG